MLRVMGKQEFAFEVVLIIIFLNQRSLGGCKSCFLGWYSTIPGICYYLIYFCIAQINPICKYSLHNNAVIYSGIENLYFTLSSLFFSPELLHGRMKHLLLDLAGLTLQVVITVMLELLEKAALHMVLKF